MHLKFKLMNSESLCNDEMHPLSVQFVLCVHSRQLSCPLLCPEETTQLAFAGSGGLTVRQGEVFSVEVECLGNNGATNSTGTRCDICINRNKIIL